MTWPHPYSKCPGHKQAREALTARQEARKRIRVQQDLVNARRQVERLEAQLKDLDNNDTDSPKGRGV
jgi:hypothetical protein